MTLLSICLPTYNGARYVLQAIRSVLAQSFGDFELVVGDDGSTDRTVELCRSVADRRVRILEFKRNVGLAGNWNRTIRGCQGQFLKYIAQDDLLLPGTLAAFMSAQSQFPDESLFFCANEQIAEDGSLLRTRGPGLRAGKQSPENLTQLLFERSNQIGGPTNTLIRTAAIGEVGGFDDRCRYYLDWVMWLQLARRFGGVYLDSPLVQIREHNGSETRRLSQIDTIRDHYRALHGLGEMRGLQAARRAFWYGLPKRLLRAVLQPSGWRA